MNKVLVSLKDRSYPVYVGKGIFGRLPELLSKHGLKRRAIVVTDDSLRERFGEPAVRGLRAAGWEAPLKTLPPGEKAKSLAALRGLYDFLIKSGAERLTPLIAIGGGAVGDAAGFAAATYYRGIPLVHVPTTLLAQADSAIGGKTAVNHPLAKNAIGAFHQPAFVLADVNVLRSLPEREFLSGMAEVVKYGLAFDPDFAWRLDRSWKKILDLSPDELARMVHDCAAWKARVVASDERDAGGRRELLNFGHTLGHALESATRYGHFAHGEAVAWGMRTAIALSAARGWLDANEIQLAGSLLGRLRRPKPPCGLRWNAVLAALRRDKKAKNARAVFILLRHLGRPQTVGDVAPSELARAAKRAGLAISGIL